MAAIRQVKVTTRGILAARIMTEAMTKCEQTPDFIVFRAGWRSLNSVAHGSL